MSLERKRHFVEELKRHFGEIIAGARKAEVASAEVAESIQREGRRKEDARSAAEFGRSSAAQKARRERAKREVDTLIGFAAVLPSFPPHAKISLGALIDVSVETEQGSEERTLFLLPVGAGTELSGPGGDGFISVITPASPVGSALMGAFAGDSFDITIGGHDREWTVVDVC